MGNVSGAKVVFCLGRKDRGHPSTRGSGDSSQTDDIFEIERSSVSFGVVPKFKVPIEEFYGSVDGFRVCPKNENETDKEQPDSTLWEESGNNSVSSHCLDDYIKTLERTERDTWDDSDNQDDQISGGKSKITFARYTLGSTSKVGGDWKTSDNKDPRSRKRGNAIEIKPVACPIGNLLPGKQYYLQNGELQWEAVTIENWNFWNGTWQVRGENGVAFPARPSALKSEEEYRFFSRERSFSCRSFSSTEEISLN